MKNLRAVYEVVAAVASNKFLLFGIALIVGAGVAVLVKDWQQGQPVVTAKQTTQAIPTTAPAETTAQGTVPTPATTNTPVYVVETDANQNKTGAGHYLNSHRVGKWEFFHPNGEVSASGQCEEGQRVGVWHFYYPDSKIMSEGRYSKTGQKHGLWTNYWPSGQRKSEGRRENGSKFGEWFAYPFDGHPTFFWQGTFNTDGQRHREWRWWSDGKLRVKDTYNNGSRTQRWLYNGGYQLPVDGKYDTSSSNDFWAFVKREPV